MKKLLTIFCLILLVSCSKEVKEVDSYTIQHRDDLVYEVNSTTPYTGISVDYDDKGILVSKTYYKEGRFGYEELYYSNGQLRIKYEKETGEDGKNINMILECFHFNGQVCWNENDGTYLSMNGETMSFERWKELYIDLIMITY